MRRGVLAVLVLALFAGAARAQGRAPLKNTPNALSILLAQRQPLTAAACLCHLRALPELPTGRYRINAAAAPTEVQEGEPLTLTVRITALRGLQDEEPRRPDLRKLAQT